MKRSNSLKGRKFLVIDTETTGRDVEKHEMISLGAIVLIDGIVTDTLEIKVKPKHPEKADPEAFKINGYDDRKWKTARPHNVAMSVIQNFFVKHSDKELVGHHVKFDKDFLEKFAKENGGKIYFPPSYIDTMDLVKSQLVPYGLNSKALDSVFEFLVWDRRNAHTALSDCEDCVRLLRNLFPVKPSFILKLRIKLAIMRFGRVIAWPFKDLT